MESNRLTYREIIARAWPIILANATVPLLGLVDTAVIGNLGGVADLGAIALGSLIFSFVYWSFGFLRMSTTGFVARASGAGDQAEVRSVLGRALIAAVVLGVVLIAVQLPVKFAALQLLSGSNEVENGAAAYFAIRIWGAPATLATFALMGCLIGLGASRRLLAAQLFLNLLNAFLDVFFAGVMRMGAEGIALGTLIAEWTALLFTFYLVRNRLHQRMSQGERFWSWGKIRQAEKFRALMSANGDILVRTLLLVFSFAWFTDQSARFGDTQLAANYVLLQLIAFSAFFLDGFAFVAEAQVGQAAGAGSLRRFDVAVKKTSVLAGVAALGLALTIVFAGDWIIARLTDIEAIQSGAGAMLYLSAIYVLLSFPAFQLDGVFIGVTQTRALRDAALISCALYMLAWWLLVGPFGITGLWWSFILYVVVRALALLLFYPKLRSVISGEPGAEDQSN